MKFSSLLSGLAGSLVLTGLHQLLRRQFADAPRMDKLGEEAIEKGADALGINAPSGDDLYNTTMAADIAGNAVYYAMVGRIPGPAVLTGAALGAVAGIGAVLLPEKMGLNPKHSNKTTRTKLLTCGLYLTGGIVAGLIYSAFKNSDED